MVSAAVCDSSAWNLVCLKIFIWKDTKVCFEMPEGEINLRNFATISNKLLWMWSKMNQTLLFGRKLDCQ